MREINGGKNQSFNQETEKEFFEKREFEAEADGAGSPKG
jgi:hypothetical protein